MNVLTSLIASPEAVRLNAVLLHFLWQGLALASLAALGLLLLRKATANARYAFLLTVLALMALAPVATYLALPAPAAVTFHPIIARLVPAAPLHALVASSAPAVSVAGYVSLRAWLSRAWIGSSLSGASA